ncbi:hypothetical protein [Haloarcula amylovorans]|uniref:hypothetical protein n=1 Tax=Haloarcula amylovorans TaxID=2562280 RepID=UPI001076AF14|nr:hypothetical protein [Halomicroarcula amylolytica]
MSESDDSGPGRREVAHRLFAAEFDDADFSYSESDEERAPNYVVTPTGARVNRLFAVGVLTEIEQVNEEVLRARIVDPTGPFVVYAGQYQPDALAFLESATPPLFVAITGKARTFEPEDGDRVFTSIRPESISEVDAGTRDRWVVQAAEQTVERIAQMASAKQSNLSGEDLRTSLVESGVEESLAAGIPLALDHYGTTGDYLAALRDLSLDAARVVAGELDEAGTLSRSPGDGTDDPLPVLTDAELDTAVASAPGSADESAGVAETETESESAVEPTATDTTTTETESVESESLGTADATPDAGETVEPTEPESEDAPTETDTDVGAADEFGGTDEAETTATETEIASTGEAASESASVDDSADDADTDDEIGDFDTEFELDENEREEIEEEYGTDFQSGSEVDEPGEADIETPDPEELAEAEASEEGAPADAADAESAPDSPGAPAGDESPEPSADAATSDAPVETPETATEAGADETTAGESADEPDAEDVDLEDAVMDVMRDLDDGDGADREEIRATVAEEYGADTDAVEDAIQDALMSGQCYEPEDGKLTPI